MDNPLQGTEPPIQELAPWWPIIGLFISLAIAGVSSLWAAYVQYNEWKRKRTEKLIDAEKEHALQSEQRKQAVEIEELKLNFDQRQKLLESLSKQFEMQLDEGRKMREELAKARQELRDRDSIIAELRATIAEMQMRIKQLEKEVHTLEQRGEK
jgi:predicted RNase H-like nuclease (RuvC/YqgF family)